MISKIHLLLYTLPMKYLSIVTILCLTIPVQAQTLYEDLQGVWQAQVVEIVSSNTKDNQDDKSAGFEQIIQAEILEGPQQGEVVQVQNDFIELQAGQKFFMNYLVEIDGGVLYSVREVDRRGPLLWLVVIFAAVVIAFGGKQGVRSLISLVGSFAAIMFILLPLLLSGYSPVLISSLVGAIVLFCAIYFTHGFNKQSTIAFIGTFSGVVLTGLLAYLSVKWAMLTGFSSDETVYLNFATEGSLNLQGLLLGGIIIGVLGVLDDIAVTQVAMVAELKRAAKDMPAIEIFKRAIHVGREHVSALVNTLVLAYAGVSLPLLLWFFGADASFTTIVNQELFATEVVRTVVGSIGLILTVPITTFLAAYYLKEEDLKHSHLHIHHH